MTTTGTLTPFALCEDLFSRCPLAVTILDNGNQKMTVRDEQGTPWTLQLCAGPGGVPYAAVDLWAGPRAALIGPEHQGADDIAGRVLRAAVPAPRPTSLFGWVDRDRVTCLIAPWEVPEMPGPQWTLLAHAGLEHASCPAYTGQPLGTRFWADLKAGRVVVLDGLLASVPEALLHVHDDTTGLGTDCFVAPRTTLLADRGPVLEKGAYLDPEVLAGRPRVQVPPLAELLGTDGITYVASRFTGDR